MARLFDDALSQYLKVTSTPVTAVPLSLACWVYCDDGALDEQEVIHVCEAGVTNYFSIFLNTNGSVPVSIVARARNGAIIGDATKSVAWSTNTWHHIAGVFATTTSRFAYLDGSVGGENTTDVTPANLDAIVIARKDCVTYKYYSGRVAEAAIWNAALTDAEVAVLAEGYSPLLVRPQSLVMYPPLIRDDDEDIVGGLSFTPTNGPTIAAHPRVVYPGMIPSVPYIPEGIVAIYGERGMMRGVMRGAYRGV